MSSESATAVSLLARLGAGEFSSEELVRSLLDRSDAPGGSMYSSISIRSAFSPRPERSTRGARPAKWSGRLAGVPVAIKDVLCVEGEPTTCGSRMLRNFRPPYDATVIAKLRGRRARSCSARPTWTSLRWARRRRIARTGRPRTRGMSRACPAARRAARRRPSRPIWLRWRWAPTPAARSASRRRSAASSGSSRPTAGSAGTA